MSTVFYQSLIPRAEVILPTSHLTEQEWNCMRPFCPWSGSTACPIVGIASILSSQIYTVHLT